MQQHAVERVHPPDALMRLVNPVLRRLVPSRLGRRLQDRVLLLRFTGRRSGKAYEIPVGCHDIDGKPSLLTNSGWRFNFRGGRDVEVLLRGEWRPAVATLVEDPTVVARVYDGKIGDLGMKQAQRQLGIKITVDRRPTREELEDVVRRSGLSIVELDVRH